MGLFFSPSYSRTAAVAVGWAVWSCEPPEEEGKKRLCIGLRQNKPLSSVWAVCCCCCCVTHLQLAASQRLHYSNTQPVYSTQPLGPLGIIACPWLVAARVNPQPVLAEIAIKAPTVLGGLGSERLLLWREKRQILATRHKREDHSGFILKPILKISGSVLFRVD